MDLLTNRPADLRVDIPHLAPLVPLMPTQQPPNTALPQEGASTTGSSSSTPDASSIPQTSQAVAAAPAPGPLCFPMGLSLFHPADRQWLGCLQQLWPKRSKDALLLLRKWLKEAIRAEKISPATRSRLSSVVSPAELLGLAQCLTATPGALGMLLVVLHNRAVLAAHGGGDAWCCVAVW